MAMTTWPDAAPIVIRPCFTSSPVSLTSSRSGSAIPTATPPASETPVRSSAASCKEGEPHERKAHHRPVESLA